MAIVKLNQQFSKNFELHPYIDRCSCGNTDCRFCLTRMMDCRKPSSGFVDNMHADLLEDGMMVAQPCTNDGYTRVDVKCGCMDCYC